MVERSEVNIAKSPYQLAADQVPPEMVLLGDLKFPMDFCVNDCQGLAKQDSGRSEPGMVHCQSWQRHLILVA